MRAVFGAGAALVAVSSFGAIGIGHAPAITLRSQEGQVLAVNKTEINVKPVVFSLNVGYRF